MDREPGRIYLENVPVEVQDHLFEGRKIEAIKLIREQSQLGLKDAKDMSEKIILELETKNGRKISALKSGCASLIVFAFSLGSIVFFQF
jgi:hypothetical protein